MISAKLKKYKLPDSPGVYFWQKGKKVLYVGRATSLRDRTRSYFANDLIKTRGPRIVDMVTKSDSIKWQKTDSVLEAIILEANLIKKLQPHYNVDDKDDKSWNYVCTTDEKLPKIIVERGKNLDFKNSKNNKYQFKSIYGPFTSGGLLREALKIIRKMFPYIDEKSNNKYSKEFYKQINLTPNFSVVGSEKEYLKNIKHIKLFFEGKKGLILKELNREMKVLAKERRFEEANGVKKKIFALSHIKDISLIKDDPQVDSSQALRIEAYDVAHTSGDESVGVMVVMENGELAKNEYRKFKLSKEIGNNDVKSLEEIINRRFRHTEWTWPKVVVVDGGNVQRDLAEKLICDFSKDIKIVSVVKDERHKARGILGEAEIVKKYKKEILLLNNEAHRFAITFHRKRLRKRL